MRFKKLLSSPLTHDKYFFTVLCIFIILYLTALSNIAKAQATFEGEFLMGSLIIGKLQDDFAKVYIDGREIKITDKGEFVFGIYKGRKNPVEIEYEYEDKSYIRKFYDVKARSFPLQVFIYKTTKKKKVFKPKGSKIVKSKTGVKKVKLPKKIIKRVKKEAEDINNIWLTNSDNTGFTMDWKWPLVGKISSKFGARRVINQRPLQPHFGVDIVPIYVNKVIAAVDGTVIYAGRGRYYAGNMIVIDHGHGVFSGYFHMGDIFVNVGDKLKQGDVVGTTGSSGYSSGEHLHWQLNWFNIALDAELVAGKMPDLQW